MTGSNPYPQRPFIIPVFITHAGCPHRCVFCNQVVIADQTNRLALAEIEAHIEQFLAYRQNNRSITQISFYGGNFLGLPANVCQDLLALADRFVRAGHVDTIRFSTRPDTITPDRLNFIKAFHVATVELGVQSMHDQVLQAARRGHTSADTVGAVKHLKDAGLEGGLQRLIGLPGDTPATALASGQQIAGLAPDFVRIYPTLVLENSRLARWYQEGRYRPLDLEEAVDLTAQLYRLFTRQGIDVVRMGLQASKALDLDGQVLAGPYHPAFGHLVYARIFRDQIVTLLKTKEKLTLKALHISVHPRNLSRVQGLKNENLAYLQAQFKLEDIRVIPDRGVGLDDVKIS